jgi:predicted PurR-regulated permease PerM
VSAASPVAPADRRRVDRRMDARIADLSLPEFRRIAITSLLSAVVLVLFLWMVRTVIIAAILAVVIAAYSRPLYARLLRATGRPAVAATLTLVCIILPVLGALAYSYWEILGVVQYLEVHQEEVSQQIDAAVHRLVFLENADTGAIIRRWVGRVSNYGASIPGELSEALVEFSVSTTIFLFTAFYAFTAGASVAAYVRATIPPRYAELTRALEGNVRGVLYGAIYATLLTQTIKSVVILAMNLAFDVPLAAVLAVISFVIGFFPIVGSWSVYLPVAAWLLVFRDARVAAALMVVGGLLFNTVFVSMYLRPKLAAERSRVLNFYWMFVGLVTGVYTFGLAGILLGPILIGLLKAIVDTLSARASWRLVESDDEADAVPTVIVQPGTVA